MDSTSARQVKGRSGAIALSKNGWKIFIAQWRPSELQLSHGLRPVEKERRCRGRYVANDKLGPTTVGDLAPTGSSSRSQFGGPWVLPRWRMVESIVGAVESPVDTWYEVSCQWVPFSSDDRKVASVAVGAMSPMVK